MPQPEAPGPDEADAFGPAPGIGSTAELAERLRGIVVPTTAIVCIGNEIAGDDGAGVAVARRLAGTVPWDVFNCQNVPESFLMKIVSRQPASVVVVDALELGARPGAVEVIAADRITGQGPSTHGPAPVVFLEALRRMHPCRQAVVGIQPEQTEFGRPLGEAVAGAVERVVEAFQIVAASA